MLVEFNISNNKSFKKKNKLSMVATSIKDLENEAIIKLDRINLLKCVALYGANASGKSNLLDSMAQMRWLVIHSAKESQVDDPLNISPFLLDEKSFKNPTTFEIIFIIDDTKYRYGFEANNDRILTEWLFYTKKIKEYPLFVRNEDYIEIVDKFSEGDRLEDKTRPNALFLSVVAQFNGEISTKIISWFNSFNMVHGIKDDLYYSLSASMLENKETSKIILDFIKVADLGIKNMKLKEIENDFSNFNDDIFTKKGKKKVKEVLDELQSEKVTDVITYHNKYDEDKNLIGEVEFSMSSQESQGTNKFFNLIGAIVDVLLSGEILVIDEFSTRLHPLLTRKIIEIFNSKKGNPNNAQLIFTTHDTNLLDKDIFRRDQIYFAEKDQYGESHIYSLVEYKPRNDEAYEKNYISGNYGGIPFIGDFDRLVKNLKIK